MLCLGSLKFENHHRRCLQSEPEKQIRCSKDLSAFCNKVLGNFQLVFIVGIFALNTWGKVRGARVKFVTGHKRVDVLHFISVEIYGPSWPMEPRLRISDLSLITHQPPYKLRFLHLSHSHSKEEKGMICVKQMTAHLRNSASLKALTQTFKSVRIVTKILASLQEY